MAIYVTSDLHLYHKNIIKFCSRPYPDIDAMNIGIINKYIDTISNHDTVLILGDITIKRSSHFKALLSRIMKKLPGKKHLVLGNHEYYSKKFYMEECKFLSVQKKIETKEFIFVHDPPPLIPENETRFYIHGHKHNTTNILRKQKLDIGVDGNDFYPWSLQNIKRKIKTLDIHG